MAAASYISCRFLYVIKFLAGVMIGFVITTQIFIWFNSRLYMSCRNGALQQNGYFTRWTRPRTEEEDVIRFDDRKKLLFVGVMTAQKYLDTRALALHNTWGQSVPGNLVFFSSEASRAENLPLIALPKVDDSYPPQKKSFLMLKYMHDHFLDKFEWFMRCDDDVYVHTERLEKFLRSVNSSKPQFIGQAGIGNKEEFGQLSLEPDENFCMGGPGMIMSRETLRLVAPHIRYCLKHLYSTHEDVEIGRCIRRFVGIPCTWSYEMQTIFYHNFFGEVALKGRVRRREVHRSITLHPVKQPIEMYKIHVYFQSLKSQELRYKTLQLQREIEDMITFINDLSPESCTHGWCSGNNTVLGIKPQLTKYFPMELQDILTWHFFSKSLYSDQVTNPRRRIEAYQEIAINNVISDMMEMINKFSKQRGRVIEFKDVLYGYYRVDPLHGVDYILDLLLSYRKYRGRKMTIPVRRHAYVQQAFSQLEIRDLTPDSSVLKQTVHFVLPLAGRSQTFERFLKTFEDMCLKSNENVKLAVVFFRESGDISSGNPKIILEELRRRYPLYDLKLVEASGQFSRAQALEIGAKLFPPDALLFFIDVDMVFDRSVLQRVRLNTVKGQRVYFPIVFSQYSPEVAGEGIDLTEEKGYWRQFGFGIVSLFHSDLVAVGGLDTNIQGWGKEDVDLYDKVVASNLTAFRAPDPGLIHKYHKIDCDEALPKPQFEMCLGSKMSSVGSVPALAKLIAESHMDLLTQSFK